MGKLVLTLTKDTEVGGVTVSAGTELVQAEGKYADSLNMLMGMQVVAVNAAPAPVAKKKRITEKKKESKDA